MHTADLLLYLAGFILLVLAAANVPSRVNLMAFGLALWVLVPLLDKLQTVH